MSEDYFGDEKGLGMGLGMGNELQGRRGVGFPKLARRGGTNKSKNTSRLGLSFSLRGYEDTDGQLQVYPVELG